MSAPDKVLQLVERFHRNLDAYKRGQYKETQVRQEFIDPLFVALGWDVYNTKGYAEAYKDVVLEDAIKVGGGTRAPDYCFRIGGTRKFFLEAKKPSVDIRGDVHPAYQLRRYAWSAKLPLSLLTDFEELAAYDCRVKPVKTDKAATARTLYFTYDQYPDRWDEIAGIFSREAVLMGSFDRYAETAERKRGTAEVDDAFLAEIESWREALARNIALRNPGLSQRELNFAVQRTIDRIIFLRICEDRGIEPYGRLGDVAGSAGVYERLTGLFRQADDRYDSGLFYFCPEKDRADLPDEMTLGLAIDDKVLRPIIGNLYYPDSPYEFSVLPADILGQVYERFLGKVIRLTPKHRAVVEDKPEVRKAGGVFYTPTYIVDYIVEHTVGQMVQDKTPRQVANLRVLDPACGSGSFLLGVYQFLLDWHRDWYTTDDPERWARSRPARLYQGPGGDPSGAFAQHPERSERTGQSWRLTAAERKRILLNNIYGVDIDSQAVEVTKLSLLLKVLEEEYQGDEATQLGFFQERALPDLADNIKCGNSLIGPDFYEGRQLALLDDEERHRVNVFDWEAEFPEIMAGGGFDAVIGNPPYVRQEMLRQFKSYFELCYESYQGTADLYVYFIEKGLKLLNKNGLYSIIVSQSFLYTTFATRLRKYIWENCAILGFVSFGGLAVFENAKDTYVCIPLFSNGSQPEAVQVAQVKSLEALNLPRYVEQNKYRVPSGRFGAGTWSLESQDRIDLFQKIVNAGTPLGEFVDGRIYSGIKTGLNEAFLIDPAVGKTIISQQPNSSGVVHPFYGGMDIRRYYVQNSRCLIAIPKGWTRDQMIGSSNPQIHISEAEAWNWLRRNHRTISEHLMPFADKAKRRQDQGDFWWELRACDYYHVLDGRKIIYPDIAKWPRFYLDEDGAYISNTAYCLGTDDLYLLGILNSKTFWFSIGNISIPFGTRAGKYRYRLVYQYMKQVPIRTIDFSDPTDVARHDRMVELVEAMLALHEHLAEAKTAHDKRLLQRQIDLTDGQIDRLVYELYGLTEKEIGIVEEATR